MLRVVKRLACVVLVSMCGCFRYAPITSLDEVNDDRIEVISAGEVETVLEHASARGHVIIGQVGEGGRAVEIDVSDSSVHVRKHKLDGVASGLLIGTGVAVTAGVVTAILVAIFSHTQNVPLEGGGF